MHALILLVGLFVAPAPVGAQYRIIDSATLGRLENWAVGTAPELPAASLLSPGAQSTAATGALLTAPILLHQKNVLPSQLLDGLAAYYSFDYDARDDYGDHDAGYTGQPLPFVITTDMKMGRGSMRFKLEDSDSNATVTIPDVGIRNVFTVSMWMNSSCAGGRNMFGSYDYRPEYVDGRWHFNHIACYTYCPVGATYVTYTCSYLRSSVVDGLGSPLSEEAMRVVSARSSRGWHHIVLRIDETVEEGYVQDGTIAMYLDGIQTASQNTVYGYPSDWPDGEDHVPFVLQYPLGLGGRIVTDYQTAEPYRAYNVGYLGRIDEVAFWNRALTDEEIAYLYDWEWTYGKAKDDDGDGFIAAVDCDDSRAEVHPGGQYVVYRANGPQGAWTEVARVEATEPAAEYREPVRDLGFYRVEETWFGPVQSQIGLEQGEIVLAWESIPPAEDVPGDGIDADCGAGLAIETAPTEAGPWTEAADAVIHQLSVGRYVATLNGTGGEEFVRVIDPDLVHCILSVERSTDGMLALQVSAPYLDSDWDGIPDCEDVCEGADDRIDADLDGTPDCADRCPANPDVTVPGRCGCGVPEDDQDGDGILDCLDQCQGFDDRRDGDGDGIPDACEELTPPGMVWIPGGPFQMGDSLKDRVVGSETSSERPVHTLLVSGFFMDRFEVTKALWDEVFTWAIAYGYSFDNAGAGKAPNHPVWRVNWYDAVKWCNARSERAGLSPVYRTPDDEVYRTGDIDLQNGDVLWNANGYRLPTEAEWEKAARGALAGARFPWGDTIIHSQANYRSDSVFVYDISPTRGYHPDYAIGAEPYTAPVGSFPPNRYGLYDMAGNMREWCWDVFDPLWYGSAAARNVDCRGPNSSSVSRVFRGGGMSQYAKDARCSYRASESADFSSSNTYYSFRCARGGL